MTWFELYLALGAPLQIVLLCLAMVWGIDKWDDYARRNRKR